MNLTRNPARNWLLGGLAASLLLLPRLHGQVWDGGAATGVWATGPNWSTDTVPGAGANLTFDSSSANGQWVITLGNTSRTVGSMTFNAASGSNGFTFNAGTATLTIGGGIVNNDAAIQTFNAPVATSAGQTWSVGAGGLAFDDVTLVGTLTADGAGTLAINGTTTLGGARTITNNTGGGIALHDLSVGGTLTLGGAGTLHVSGTTTLTGNRTITNNSTGSVTFAAVAGTNRNLTVAGTGTTEISGTIATGTGALTKNNAGMLILSGANTYSGGTTVNAGILDIRNDGALGAATAGTTIVSGAALQIEGGITVTGEQLTLNGTGLAGTGALRNVSGNNTWTGVVRLASASQIESDSGVLTISGTVRSSNTTTRALTVGGAGDVAISGVINTTIASVTKTDAGTLTLSGANTYTGATNINGGTLRLGADNVLSNRTDVTVAAGATLDLNSYADTIDALAGGGIVTLGGGTLTVGGNNGSSTFSGSFGAGDMGTFAKVGSGTLTFGAGMNLAGGTLALNAGTIALAAGTSFTGGALVLNGGTFLLSGASGTFDSLAVNADSILDFGPGGDSTLDLRSLSIDPTATLTIRNWTDTADYFYSLVNPGLADPTIFSRIAFSDYPGVQPKWLSFDNEISPVPDPSACGAALLVLSLLLAGWRRIHQVDAYPPPGHGTGRSPCPPAWPRCYFPMPKAWNPSARRCSRSRMLRPSKMKAGCGIAAKIRP